MSIHQDLVIVAYEKGYRVNDDGTVTSSVGRTLRPYVTKRGYPRISVKMPGERYSKSLDIHRLAAYQWYGDEAMKPGVVVRHRDDNPLNCRRENILIGTQGDNMRDMRPAVRPVRAEKGAAKVRKLTPERVEEFRRDRAGGMLLKDLCTKYGLAKSTASLIARGKTYPAGSSAAGQQPVGGSSRGAA